MEPEELVELARRAPDSIVVVDEAYVEFGARSAAPWVDELPNLVVLRTLSKAFGLAALRVGYALAHPDTAALLDARRAPASISAPAAAIAAAALREPRLLDLEATIAERERVRTALCRRRSTTAPPVAGNFVWIRTDEPLAAELERQGIVVRAFAEGIRATVRRPTENDVLLRALGAEPGPPPGREATVIRTTTETALRLTLALDGTGRGRVATGIGFLDHLLTLFAFHAGADLELLAGGDLEVDEHHLVEDVLAALGVGARARRSAGEKASHATARRSFPWTRLGRLPPSTSCDDRTPRSRSSFTATASARSRSSLLTHALERFAIEAGCTVHVQAVGRRRPPRRRGGVQGARAGAWQAVAPGDAGIRSTKGEA